ncbi:MAG: TetR/AcrR family transcriptional regulator [Saprospiraceae bacterium]|nr:TetR/AcrR family transcriptional regulator [Saprospiraceae bacterium]
MTVDQTTEERIIIAAKQVFFEKGMSGARMQDIADRAGINKALLHYYFRSKEKLFFIIFQESIQSFLPQIQTIFSNTPDIGSMIRGFVQTYMAMLNRQPYLAAFIVQEINRNPKSMWEAMNHTGSAPFPIHAFQELVAKEVDAGNIRPIDPLQLWAHIMGLCIFPFLGRPLMKMIFQYSDPQFDHFLVERQEEVIHLLISSLKPE